MPKPYHDFLYIIPEMTSEGIAQAVRAYFDEPLCERRQRITAAIAYLAENQTYDRIAERVLSFINENTKKG